MTFHTALGLWNGEPGMDRLLYYAIQEELQALAMEFHGNMAPGPQYWGRLFKVGRRNVKPRREPLAVFAGVEI